MTEKQKRNLRISAMMEGHATEVANMGRKIPLSMMEVICLVNFAEIGLLSVFSAAEGDMGDEAEIALNQHIDRIRKRFAGHGQNGLQKLSATATALLRGMLMDFIVR